MSQMAAERPAPPAPAGGGNALTRKVGPLPVWGWLALIAAGGVGYIWWRNKQNASTAAAADTTGTTSDTTGTDDAQSIATLQSEIQQLQGEVSTDETGEGSGGGSGGGTSNGGKTRTITVEQRQTLAQLARRRKWPAARLKAAEALNGLSASSELRKGQVLKLPA